MTQAEAALRWGRRSPSAHSRPGPDFRIARGLFPNNTVSSQSSGRDLLESDSKVRKGYRQLQVALSAAFGLLLLAERTWLGAALTSARHAWDLVPAGHRTLAEVMQT